MTTDAHPDGSDSAAGGHGPSSPADRLLAAARLRADGWLTAGVREAVRRAGPPSLADDPELGTVVVEAVRRLLDDLERLLLTDVDEQRTNPLSLFRSAVVGPTRWLVDHGVVPSRVDGFVVERFPDDLFGLGPATWSDIHPDLHDPGIAWGAWKAMLVLRRRSAEGRR